MSNQIFFSFSSDDIILPALAKTNSAVRILEPSADALADEGELHPCPTCGRKFVQKTFDRHIKICEKVTTKKRKVFDGAKKRLEGLPDVPIIRKNEGSAKKKPAKPEDEFQKCPHCSRNFGPKVRHFKTRLGVINK
jgi:ribosomal protein L37AE/L43A